jgi:hypothetical protein
VCAISLIAAAIVLRFAASSTKSRIPSYQRGPHCRGPEVFRAPPKHVTRVCDVFTSSVSTSAPADLFKLKSPARISQVASRIGCWFATQGLAKLRAIFGHDLSPQSLRTTERHGVTSSAKRSAKLSKSSLLLTGPSHSIRPQGYNRVSARLLTCP